MAREFSRIRVSMPIKLKRAYDKYSRDDGYRILVDGLWPRGVSRAKAHIDLWLKEIAPSDALRKWYSHDPDRWPEFQRKYKKELSRKKALLKQLKDLVKRHKTVTLVYGSKSPNNNAAVLSRVVKG
jgi:uncharacterized protein YeaO (DUF488 family)